MLDGAVLPILYVTVLVAVIGLALRARLGAGGDDRGQADAKKVLVEGMGLTAGLVLVMIAVTGVLLVGFTLFILEMGAEIWGGSS